MSGASAGRDSELGEQPELAKPWALTPEAVLTALGVESTRGLSASQAASRLQRYGRNALKEVKSRGAWSILIAQFKSLLVALLAGAGVAAAFFAEWLEAGAIVGVLVINALLGFFTELKAARSMEALRKMGAAQVTLRRDGELSLCPASVLVPGDIVVLEAGDIVTADLRVVEASKLQANESTLTGESLPTSKSEAPVAEDTDLAERSCMLFKGTTVTRGSGLGVVVATGMQSELGQISSLVSESADEETPLERRLNRLGQGLVWVTLAIAAFVAISGYLAGHPPLLIIETAVALAVAAVPEGLPIIATIALARGMHRMVSRNALVNRLSAVETLGATSVICTDKTGTLTENRMTVSEIIPASLPDAEQRLLSVITLCNNAELKGERDGVGDPMEVALLAATAQAGLQRKPLLETAPEVLEVAFEPELKMMATINGKAAPYRVSVKGSHEAVLSASNLSAREQQRWLQQGEQLAEQGLRVLGVADKQVQSPAQKPYEALEFLGLVAMQDPPRVEVRDTIDACHAAGIRVVMVTGDHPVTALNIAKATGLISSEAEAAVLGKDLEQLPDAEDRQRLIDANVFARVSPKQKLNLIALHQSTGAVVAMTGDGVNDAPALSKADIGVAMGERGTAAAREAAAMVLKDDDLSTIVVAVAEGRVIFDNIRNFCIYLLSCNISEVLVVGLTAAVRAPLPLLPLQILFLNLVTDVFPALALGVGGAADNVMLRKPRPGTEKVLEARHWREILGYGLLMTACVLGAYYAALEVLGLARLEAIAVSFLTLAFSQLLQVFNMRQRSSGLVLNEITRNGWVWSALALCVVVVLLAVYVPFLSKLLSIQPPSAKAWGLIASMSCAPLILGQLTMELRSKLAQVTPLRR